MTFATMTNVIVMIFCAAVLVQSLRMMKSLAVLKTSDLPAMVKALDGATAQARFVLSELKDTLRTDGAANMRALTEAETIRDELGVMIGIANAAADRLVESASARRADEPVSEAA